MEDLSLRTFKIQVQFIETIRYMLNQSWRRLYCNLCKITVSCDKKLAPTSIYQFIDSRFLQVAIDTWIMLYIILLPVSVLQSSVPEKISPAVS